MGDGTSRVGVTVVDKAAVTVAEGESMIPGAVWSGLFGTAVYGSAEPGVSDSTKASATTVNGVPIADGYFVEGGVALSTLDDG